VPRRDERIEDARALLAICELMQCKLLSPTTIAYLSNVREMLEKRIEEAAERQNNDPVSA